MTAVAAIAPPATPATNAAAAPSSGEPGAFARELDRAAKTQDSPDAPGPEDAAANGAAKDGADAPTRSRVANTDAPAHARAAARKADADSQTQAADDKPAAKLHDDAADDNAPAGLAALMPGLMAPQAAPPAGVNTSTAARAVADAARASAVQARGAKAEPPAITGAAAEKAPGMHAQGDAEPTVFPVALAAAASAAAGDPPAVAPAAASAPSVPEAHLGTPLDSPGFAPALGAQVSLFVRDGVSEARLQLNPADLGPITVQIQIDGSNAQINLAAEQAPTRQALEQALPALATALQDNGLTLTGGGVFEQPRQPQGDAPPDRGGGGSSPRDDGSAGGIAAAPAARATRSTARGVVDLYA